MKRVIFLIFINIVLVLFQSSMFSELFGVASNPNLVLAFAFALYFLDLDDMGIISAFIGGIWLDLFGFSIVGISSVTMVGSLLFFIYVKRYLFRGFASNIVSVIVSQSVYLLFLNGNVLNFSQYLKSGFYTTLSAIVIYYIFRKFSRYFFPSGYRFSK